MPHLIQKLATLVAVTVSTPSWAQNIGVNPQGSGPILSAMNWMQGTLLGNLATTAAVIAVAVCGLMMLTGRMNWRFGATVIMGCFILFGSTAIVAGIQSAAAAG